MTATAALDYFARSVRERLFVPRSDDLRRVGAEIEMLPVLEGNGLPWPLEPTAAPARHDETARVEEPQRADVEMVVVQVGDEHGVERLRHRARNRHDATYVTDLRAEQGVGQDADTVQVEQDGAVSIPRDRQAVASSFHGRAPPVVIAWCSSGSSASRSPARTKRSGAARHGQVARATRRRAPTAS